MCCGNLKSKVGALQYCAGVGFELGNLIDPVLVLGTQIYWKAIEIWIVSLEHVAGVTLV